MAEWGEGGGGMEVGKIGVNNHIIRTVLKVNARDYLLFKTLHKQ